MSKETVPRPFFVSIAKFFITSRPMVDSKQVKQKVARKKMAISKLSRGMRMMCSHCWMCGRCVTECPAGCQLSARRANAQMKFNAHSDAAVQPGAVNQKYLELTAPRTGPRMKPRPKAMPIKPILAERFSGG